GRTAHARDAAGVFEVGSMTGDENDVVLGVEVAEDGEDFNVEALDGSAFQDRQPVALHAGSNLADAHVPGRIEEAGAGGRRGGGRGEGGSAGGVGGKGKTAEGYRGQQQEGYQTGHESFHARTQVRNP